MKNKKFSALIKVYFSEFVEIEVEAPTEDDAIQDIYNYDHNHLIDDKLQGIDFSLETEYCDEISIDDMHESEVDDE